MAIGFLVSSFAWGGPSVGDHIPPPLMPQLSSDGNTLYDGVQPLIIVDRPKPAGELRRIPPPFNLTNLPEAATATFTITYIPAGGTDLWGEPCYTFPESAKSAFNAAAAIWGNLLQSSVPITIKACWASFSGSTLGYSGGGTRSRNFTNAPMSNTWYNASLANALSGSDLSPSNSDMHITYNSNFDWYYGTDGNPPSTQHDLMSVVLHEIAHGLNFSGTASYSGGQGSLGTSGSFGIYDTFMKDGSGNWLTGYTNPSASLGSVLTGGNLWFHGSNAMAANVNGGRVKMYAPSTWAGGSSYSHLDYTTFNNTSNQLMVYAISAGEAIHDPGPVTKGLLKDLGWSTSEPPTDTPLANGVALNQTMTASVQQGTWKYYYVDIPSGAANLVTDLYNLTADLDLYVRQGSKPTISSYDCGSWLSGTNSDSCTLSSPTPGRWWIGVNNWATGTISYTVKASWKKSKGLPWLLLLE